MSSKQDKRGGAQGRKGTVTTACWLTVPRQENGVVEKVLKNLEEHSVVLLPVLFLWCLLAGAAWAVLCPRQVRLGGLGVLLCVQEPCGWDTDWDLELCLGEREKQTKAFRLHVAYVSRAAASHTA